jgi:cytosine/adenosine deaminase-related metal-dependent hydrolase
VPDLIVEGAIVDALGARPAYVRFRDGRVVETGKVGTDSSRGRLRRVPGIVFPQPVNGHTHLGDAVSRGEPPHTPLRDIVAPPDGLKFRLLRDTPEPAKRRAMTAELRRLAREGVAAILDFREEGTPGIRSLQRAAQGGPVRPFILGRPLARPLDRTELRGVLDAGDGIGLSSAREESAEVRKAVARACRAAKKRYALHASEEVREKPDDYLEPRPDLLVHLTAATAGDLELVRDAGVTVAVCPRSNALFGRRPDLATLERLDVPTLLGTDNAMFHAPSLFRELEFAYVSSRLAHRPVRPEFLVRAVCVTPWGWLGNPAGGRVEAGGTGSPLVARLPPDDPAYQLATRATAHLIFRPGTGHRRRSAP